MKQCKCEHWQQCPVCMPHRFDAEGNRLPPEPTPLQAAQAQIKALTAALFQMQEAATALAAQREWVGLTDEEIDKTYETQIWDARRSYARAIEAKLKEKNA